MVNANPKDGWKAIVVAVCASVVQAVILGINNSFPNFIGDMLADDELRTDNSRLALVQACSLGIAGVLAVPAGVCVQRLGSRVASLIASVAVIVCMVITSVGANSGESMIGLYSVPMGVGVAFMMSPGATATSSWFDKRAALGMGICFTGGGTGSLSIPRIAGALSKSFSWRTSFLILAAIGALGVIASIFVCIRPTDGDAEDEDEGSGDQRRVIEEGEAHATGDREELVRERDDGGESVPMRQAPSDSIGTSSVNVLPPTQGAIQAVVPSSTVNGGTDNERREAAGKRPFDYHTDSADLRNLFLNCILTRNFIGLFFSYAFFSLGFYSLLYICVPYANSMGTGVYSKASTITVDEASNVFVPFGIMETIGGPLLGYVATRTDERLVFIASMGVLTLTSGYYAIARTLADHLGLFVIFGFGCVAFFATFGTMVAQRFHGPNLPVLMSCGFSGSAIGGFLGSTVSIQIANAQGGDYTYVTTLISLMFFCAGLTVMFVVQDVEDSDAAQNRRIRRDGKRLGIAEEQALPGEASVSIPAPLAAMRPAAATAGPPDSTPLVGSSLPFSPHASSTQEAMVASSFAARAVFPTPAPLAFEDEANAELPDSPSCREARLPNAVEPST